MAYMGRGDGPSINIDNGSNNDNGVNNVHYGPHIHYYIPLSNTYIRIQIIVSLFILIAGAIAYVFTYKSTIIDPIENIKNSFINTYLILMGTLVISALAMHLFSKKAQILLKGLKTICIVSIITMVVFFGIKLKLDTDYTETKFEQLYIKQNNINASETKSKIDVGMSGIKVKTEQEYYIDECIKLYNFFNVRVCGTFGLHILLNILLIYQISRISKIEDKKERLNNDDLILFDEEQNVKY